MKLLMKILSTILFIGLAVVPSLPAQTERQLTTTLLPVREQSANTDPGGLLWIQNEPQEQVFLQFDLSRLPRGLTDADFKRCTLRLVAQNVVYQPADNPNTGGSRVIVKGRLADDDFSVSQDTDAIISLSTLTEENRVALKATEALRQAVYREYAGDKKISLMLFSESHKASSLFYSTRNCGSPADPSNLPRLVIEYLLGPPTLLETLSWPQHQQNPEHTGRGPWIPFKNPTGFSLAEIGLPQGTIADYPLIYRGNIYLVNKILDLNHLVALDFKGKELWRKDIGNGTVQRSPVISRNGIYYTVTENKIAGYDLNRFGELFAAYPEEGILTGKLSAYTDLTCGNDGSLFAALKENGLNYIYGFTTDLKPFIKAGPFQGEEKKISTVTVSPDGRQIFAQIPEGAVVNDITNPAQPQIIKLGNAGDQPWEYYHVPVAGPAGGVMVFSDFTSTANKGNVWGYAADKRIWNAPGTLIPQPVLGLNDFVYFIQGGALQRHHYNQHGLATRLTSGTELKTTSNLVMDGADNLYFWDNGYLHGYRADGERLFAKIPMTSGVKTRNLDESGRKIEGPEQFLRLMLGSDGTLWANNKNGNALFAFKPQYAESDLVLRQEDLKSNMVYRAAGVIAMAEGGLTLEADKKIMLQARNGITFPRGLAVKKGAGLICRTGF